jgi:hypothetical protein
MLTFWLTLAVAFVIDAAILYRVIKNGLDQAKENNRLKKENNLKKNFTII